MNAVLTIGVLTGLFMIGLGRAGRDLLLDRPVIGAVEPGSPAEAAGLRAGRRDRLHRRPAHAAWEDALIAIVIRPDTAIELGVKRGGVARR